MKLKHRFKASYWSSSAFAKWLRKKAGLTNPTALTLEGWDEHEKQCKEKSPIVHYITDVFFNKVQRVVSLPWDIVYTLKCYHSNVKNNSHVLDGGLEKGQWYDLSYRILPCLFNELVKYIEKEKGLSTLEWEKSLVCDEHNGYDKDDPEYGQLTRQAVDAIEQESLYKWYKEVYLQRPDPHDVFNKHYAKWGEGFGKMCEEQKAEWKECNSIYTKILEQYVVEEEEMLVRLVKLRYSLWT